MNRIIKTYLTEWYHLVFPFSRFDKLIWGNELVNRYFSHYYKTNLVTARKGYNAVIITFPIIPFGLYCYYFFTQYIVMEIWDESLFKQDLLPFMAQLMFFVATTMIFAAWLKRLRSACCFNRIVHFELNCWYTAMEHLDGITYKTPYQIVHLLDTAVYLQREAIRVNRSQHKETRRLVQQARELRYIQVRLLPFV